MCFMMCFMMRGVEVDGLSLGAAWISETTSSTQRGPATAFQELSQRPGTQITGPEQPRTKEKK